MKRKTGAYSLIIGLILLVAAVGYVLRWVGVAPEFDMFFRGWWIILIMIPFAADIISRGLRGYSLYWLAALAVILILFNRFGAFGILWRGAVVAGLIAIGGVILFKSRVWKQKRIIDAATGASFYLPVCRAVFKPVSLSPGSFEIENGENDKKKKKAELTPEDYSHGLIVSALFSPVTLDLSAVPFHGDTVIEIFALFGHVTLTLPHDAALRIRRGIGFGGVTVNSTTPEYSDGATLFIKINPVFAGVEIK